MAIPAVSSRRTFVLESAAAGSTRAANPWAVESCASIIAAASSHRAPDAAPAIQPAVRLCSKPEDPDKPHLRLHPPLLMMLLRPWSSGPSARGGHLVPRGRLRIR